MHILKIVDKNRIVWGVPKVLTNYDSKGLENPDTLEIYTYHSGQVAFTIGMQPCELDNTESRDNKENREQESRKCKTNDLW